jgi:membrane protease YdiL (CAAX protease family)
MVVYKKYKITFFDSNPSLEEFFYILGSLIVCLVLLFVFSNESIISKIVPVIWLLSSSIFLFNKYGIKQLHLKISAKNNLIFFLYLFSLMLLFIFSFILKAEQQISFSFSFLCSFLYTCLIVPFIEEFFFRGLLLDFFWHTFNSAFVASILITTVFILLHPLYALIPMAILSFFLCTIAIISKNILWPTIFHIIWNSLTSIYLIPNINNKLPVMFLIFISTATIAYLIKKNETKSKNNIISLQTISSR